METGEDGRSARHLGPIEVDRIFLYEENPRHEPIESGHEIIEYLCKDEQVYNLHAVTAALDLLARDAEIAKKNPPAFKRSGEPTDPKERERWAADSYLRRVRGT